MSKVGNESISVFGEGHHNMSTTMTGLGHGS